MSGSFSSWTPDTSYVQAGMTDGRYATAAYTLISAGPPRMANIGGAAAVAGAIQNGTGANNIVYPMGLVQNFSIGQSQQISRLFEIGSNRSYFINGRTMGQISMSRVYYHGASLLRLLYAYYQDLVPGQGVVPMFDNLGAQAMANPHDVIVPPGYENVYINLASDLFTQPVGLLIYTKDIDKKALSAVYAEAVTVPSHNWGSDAQGVIIQEQVSLNYERLVPVLINSVKLIKGSDGNASGADTTFNQLAA